MSFRRFWRRTKLIVRKVLRQRDSPRRIARGLAAGSFVSAVPTPGLQIPLSLLAAWAARGNKLVAIFPQFISNAATMVPLAFLQFKIGAWLWPAQAAEAREAMDLVGAAIDAWRWSAPAASLKNFFAALGGLGLDILGPLAVGVLLTGAVMAAIVYPLTVMAVRSWQARQHRRHAPRRIAATKTCD